MRVIIQRVNYARVEVEGSIVGSIGHGLFILGGWEESDTEDDLTWMAGKIARLRIFNDVNGLMNLNVSEAGGTILLVSQFTLYASTKKGNRPSFIRSLKQEPANLLYQNFILKIENELNAKIQTGVFGAHMKIDLQNDGPVSIFIDSKNRE